ncbi:hypothetical protein BCT62_24740 [Vibrio splendidus]|nr:hypothetical protein BCT62_24740 [Vibrio splendidus]
MITVKQFTLLGQCCGYFFTYLREDCIHKPNLEQDISLLYSLNLILNNRLGYEAVDYSKQEVINS